MNAQSSMVGTFDIRSTDTIITIAQDFNPKLMIFLERIQRNETSFHYFHLFQVINGLENRLVQILKLPQGYFWNIFICFWNIIQIVIDPNI